MSGFTNKFLKKCSKLGCSSLPDGDYFEKIDRKRVCVLLENFLLRTDDRQTIDCIRKNILIKASKDTSRSYGHLPAQLQSYFKLKKLEKDLSEASGVNSEARKREIRHLDLIKTNQDVITNRSDIGVVLRNTLQASIKKNDEKIESEQKIAEQIKHAQKQVIPTQSGDILRKDFENAISILKSFSLRAHSDEDTTNLVSNVKKSMNSIPNNVIFQWILKDVIKNYKKISEIDRRSTFERSPISRITKDQVIPNLSRQLVTLGISALARNQSLTSLKSKCGEKIHSTTYELEEMLNIQLEYSYQNEEVVRDFMNVMLQNFIQHGKLVYIKKFIGNVKNVDDTSLNHFATSAHEIKKINAAVIQRIYDMQLNMAQMFALNDKVNTGCFYMVRSIQEMKNRSNMSKITRTCTYEINYHKELLKFLSSPHEKLFYNTRCSLSEQIKTPLMKTFNKIKFTTFNGSIDTKFLTDLKKEIDRRRRLLPLIKNFVGSQVKAPEKVNLSKLEESLMRNREMITELIDNCFKSYLDSKSLLKELKILVKFCDENPMKKFVVDSLKFDGKSFKAYESDFNLYHRMIKN